jgi:hypothetical protein
MIIMYSDIVLDDGIFTAFRKISSLPNFMSIYNVKLITSGSYFLYTTVVRYYSAAYMYNKPRMSMN